jgi:hypothetical protein
MLQARESALAAARGEAAAAGNALKTVETGINYYAARKEYIKLKDIAEASDVAGKVWLRPGFGEPPCTSHLVPSLLTPASTHGNCCQIRTLNNARLQNHYMHGSFDVLVRHKHVAS